MKKIFLVAGARPNFMKIAPVLRAMNRFSDGIQPTLVHTGQHYDSQLSDTFFNSLGIKSPEYNLEAGSGSHAVQTAGIMVKFEAICLSEKPDIVVVVGDVNSTIAAGLVAKKLNILLAHIEAGLRSRDLRMPEEINRMATDAITDIFFTTEKEATQNLLAEGHCASSVHFVGQVMIDNLFYQLRKLENRTDGLVDASIRKLKQALPKRYLCMTMHRHSNVDNNETLSRLLQTIGRIARNVPVVFPCHPHTRRNIEQFGMSRLFETGYEKKSSIASGIIITEPLGYDDFLYLWKDAAGVLTDSGGLQEETTALKIPCITMRTTTERPITVEIGSNEVVGIDEERIIKLADSMLQGSWKESRIPDLWDGKASERIVEVLRQH